MKQHRSFIKTITYVLFALSLLLITSCTKGGGGDGDLLGRWEKSTQISYYPGGYQSGSSQQIGYVVEYYEFQTGGKGVRGQTSPSPSYSTYQRTFTWTRSGNTITIDGSQTATLNGTSLRIGGSSYHHSSW